MLVKDDEVKDLKVWLVKKLETISEADSQILSDYVLALLQGESSESELQSNAVENLTDFLGENTRRFIDDVFQALKSKVYLPGYVPQQDHAASIRSKAIEQTSARENPKRQDTRRCNDSAGRKRNHYESNGYYVDHDAPVKKQYAFDGRQPSGSATQRGSDRWRGDVRTNGHGRYNDRQRLPDPGDSRSGSQIPVRYAPQGHSQGHSQPYSQAYPQAYSSIPPQTQQAKYAPHTSIIPGTGPTTLPFDPNAAIQAVMTLQAMGFTIPLPGAGLSDKHQPAGRKSQKRCHNYDKQGFCARGNTCHYQHIDTPTVATERSSLPLSNAATSTNGGPGTGARVEKMTATGFNGQGSSSVAGFPESKHPKQPGKTSSLVIENIPDEYLTEEKVRGFFLTFGEIKNINVRAYNRSATIEFQHLNSARLAMKSPKAVFDSRFVKVRWYNPAVEDNHSKHSSEPIPESSVSGGLGFDKAQFEKANEAAQKRHEARMALLSETEHQKSEILAKREELETLKAKEIQKLKDLFATKGESLPAEFESAENDKTDDEETATLLAQLKALEDEAKSLGISAAPWSNGSRGSTYRGRGAQRGWRGQSTRGRGGYHRGALIGNGMYNLDNRPKSVRVEGVDFDDLKEERLKQYLVTLGDFVSVESEEDRRRQVVTFKDRVSAETFYYGQREIPGVGNVQFSWGQPQIPAPSKDDPNTEMKGMIWQTTPQSGLTSDTDGLDTNDRNATTTISISEAETQRDDEVNDSGGEDYEWIS